MGKGVVKEILLLLLFFGSVWAMVSYFSEDEAEDWEIIPENLYEKLGDFVLDDLNRTSRLELIANDSFNLESWSEILDRLDFTNSECKALYITNNAEVNAYTLPGNNIVIYSGLIEFIESGEELAAVLAHELGHVKHKHVQELLTERFAVASLIMIVSGDGGGNLLLEVSDALFTAAFSRENEQEADEYGLQLLTKAKLPASGMLHFFERLEEEKSDVPEILSAFSSHPLSKERIEFIRNYGDKLSDIKSLKLDWAEFQEEMLLLSGHSNQ